MTAKLQGLLSFSSAVEDGGSAMIVSPQVTIRRLRLEPDYFAALSKSDAIREKIPKMCPRGGKIYLVVGMMSFHIANPETAGNLCAQRESKATIAAGTAASAAAAAGFPVLTSKPNNGNLELVSGIYLHWIGP